jgi:hypothetical protein
MSKTSLHPPPFHRREILTQSQKQNHPHPAEAESPDGTTGHNVGAYRHLFAPHHSTAPRPSATRETRPPLPAPSEEQSEIGPAGLSRTGGELAGDRIEDRAELAVVEADHDRTARMGPSRLSPAARDH